MLQGATAGPTLNALSTKCSGSDAWRTDLTNADLHLEGYRYRPGTKLRVGLSRRQWWHFWRARSRHADVWLFCIPPKTDCSHNNQLDDMKQILVASEEMVATYHDDGQCNKQKKVRILCMQDYKEGIDFIGDHDGIEGVTIWRSLCKQRCYIRFMAMALMVLLSTIIVITLGLTILTPKTKAVGTSTAFTTGLAQQLYLTASNVSEWKSQNDASQWRLRLDDQSMIPVSMLDSRELKVQAWFEDTFPVLKLNRDSGRYLDAEYLAIWDEIILDEKYHIAHCVAAFRRYLLAVETGHHICPKDVSLTHLKHCTQQLENFVFRSNDSWYREQGQTITLKWHTDVCF